MHHIQRTIGLFGQDTSDMLKVYLCANFTFGSFKHLLKTLRGQSLLKEKYVIFLETPLADMVLLLIKPHVVIFKGSLDAGVSETQQWVNEDTCHDLFMSDINIKHFYLTSVSILIHFSSHVFHRGQHLSPISIIMSNTLYGFLSMLKNKLYC